MEATIYNQVGKESGKIKLPEKVFGLPWNNELVHQVITSLSGNIRTPWAHTKNRGEVKGTGKKPWKQKGTGRARHGSRRSPIWVGGGIAHGPRNERDYSRKVNKKMKSKALFSILSKKFKDNELMLVDKISLPGPKTKEAKGIITALSKVKGFQGLSRNKNAAIIALSSRDNAVEKSFRNFSNVSVNSIQSVNPLDLMQYKYIVLSEPEVAFKALSSRRS